MLRICALNESGSSLDSDGETHHVETKEAQEANLLNLYTAALKSIAAGNIKVAKANLSEIISSPIFQDGKEDALACSLRYNVHKNLGECLLQEGNIQEAQDELLIAAEMDGGDITLWFKIAGTAVKLNNLYMCRSALEQGLKCNPNHWPSIENLITVTFKLGDFLACLGYCSLAEEREPGSDKVILFKSKVYKEMPFLQDVYDDKDFVPIPTEIETFRSEIKTEPVREPIELNLKELTLESLAENIFFLNERCDENGTCLNPIETVCSVDRLYVYKKNEEESRLKVSIQNLVDEIIDIIEEEEEIQTFIENLLDELLCNIFGVEPKTIPEKISGQIINEILETVMESKGTKKKSVVIEAKPRVQRKPNPYDEIPDELIEKRRSSRKSRLMESINCSDASNDPINIQTPRELLKSFLPPNLKLAKESKSVVKSTRSSNSAEPVSKSLFTDEKVKNKWFSPEQESQEVHKFLQDNSGKPIWHLMRSFLDLLFRLDARLVWPRGLVEFCGKIYESWRSHLGTPLSVEHPEEKLTQEFLRYYILGCECIVGCLLEDEEDEDEEDEERIPPHLSARLHEDLEELYYILPALPVDLHLRIHSLRFYYFILVKNEDEILYESGELTRIFDENPGIVICNSLPQYKIASRKYLEEYSGGINRNKELEELNQYYETKRYSEIVTLLLGTLESTCFTPSKETSRVPDKETQIDILVESLFHEGMYVKCLKWTTIALSSTWSHLIVDKESEEERKLTPEDWTIVESYLKTIECCISNTADQSFEDFSFVTASKLAMILIQILTTQIEDTPSSEQSYDLTLPWILLYKLIVWGEECLEEKIRFTMPGSLNLLCSAHDYLGQKSCCTSNNGRLLTYIVDIFIPLLSGEVLPVYSEQIKSNLEQAIYCLFAHPSKKTRVKHLADHNVSQLGLTWQPARKLYNYMKPEKVPEHDDVKLLSVSADTDSFMKRLVAVLPSALGLDQRKQTAQQYVQGKKKKLKIKKVEKLSKDLKDLFYLLADYAFKNTNDLDKAIEYYTLDISFNPKRYDTWAALALAQASKMDQRLNSCKKLIPDKMLEFINAVETCFKKCLALNEENSNLWIEYGNFSYNVHSYISRTLNNSEEMNMELFDKLEAKKDELLKTSLKNYNKTLEIFEKDGIDENDVDERWLIHYMIGKINEKSNSPITKSLRCYITSMECLEKNGSILPKKVNYNSPQPLSLETMEIYYRVHASILKYLVPFENKETGLDVRTRLDLYDIMRTVQLNKVYSTNAQESKLGRFSRKRKILTIDLEESGNKVERVDETATTVMRDVLEVMDNLIDDVEYNNDETKCEVSKLISLALMGLEDVAFHFFHHFKALYRLAHYYFFSTKHKNLGRVQKLLLAGANERNVLCPGLFFGRKPNQIFNDIWRIPISEIDRPGSFASHCSKILTLLLDVLRTLPDLTTLTDIALQLRKPPTEENKFVHENDRLEVGTMANTYLINTIKQIVTKAVTETETRRISSLLDIYRVYQKLVKQWPGKDKEVLSFVKELYGKMKGRSEKDKISNDEVFKFCNQEMGKQRSGSKNATSSAVWSSSGGVQANKPNLTNTSTIPTTGFQPRTYNSKQSTPSLQSSSQPSNPSSNLPSLTPESQKHFTEYLDKISRFQEMILMNIPNMSLNHIASLSDLKFEDQPRNVNSLFQALQKMSQSDLKSLNIDNTKLNLIARFATSVGLIQSAVNCYVSRIKSIINPVPVPVVQKPKPILQPTPGSGTSPAVNKVNLVKPQFKPKMTEAQRNLKNLQMLLKQQENNAVSAAKNILASNSVTITNAASIKSQAGLSVPAAKSIPLPVPRTSSPVANKPPVSQSTIGAISSNISEKFKNLPSGITLTVERKESPGPPEHSKTTSSGSSPRPVYQTGKTMMKSNSPVPRGSDPTIQRAQNYTKKTTQKSKLAQFRNQVVKSLMPGAQGTVRASGASTQVRTVPHQARGGFNPQQSRGGKMVQGGRGGGVQGNPGIYGQPVRNNGSGVRVNPPVKPAPKPSSEPDIICIDID